MKIVCHYLKKKECFNKPVKLSSLVRIFIWSCNGTLMFFKVFDPVNRKPVNQNTLP